LLIYCLVKLRVYQSRDHDIKELWDIWHGIQQSAVDSAIDGERLFHDLLSVPMLHCTVWSVITAHKLTPAKRDVNTVVSDQRSRFTAPSIGHYHALDT